jgi:GNAT superfamily N-acetyltransferase
VVWNLLAAGLFAVLRSSCPAGVVLFPPASKASPSDAACMWTRPCALTHITVNNGCVLELGAIERVERDRVAVSALLRACPEVDRVRRAGSIEVEIAAERLLPRSPLDVVLGAVGPRGALAAVVNANAIAEDGETFEVAILVAPAWRGRGLAATLLRTIATLLPSSATALGVIGRDNTAALSLLCLAPEADVTIDPDSVTFRVAVPARR